MSRVDEEREVERAAQRLAEAKRTEQAKRTERVNADVAFSKLVGKQQGEQRVFSASQAAKQQSTAKNAIAHVLHEAEAGTQHLEGEAARLAQTHQQGALLQSKRSGQSVQAAVGAQTRDDGQQASRAKAGSLENQSLSTQGREVDFGVNGRTSEDRKADAKVQREILADRGASSDSKKDGSAGTGARGEKGELKTGADQGGKGGQSGGGGKDGKDGPPATLRFNPALMPPVAIAKPKEVTGSERLRKVANELAQKIVERVRIGTNAAGKVEFQIDLRSDVLSGLSVKVSSQNGKIQATFSGTNKEVLKLVEEQGDALKSALLARGLTLEAFKVERRA